MALQTILFDLGNVLLRFSHERMYSQMGSLCRRGAAELESLLTEAGLIHAMDLGQLKEIEFHRQFERLVDQAVDFPALLRAASDIFTLAPGMEELVAALRRDGLRLVLISNTCRPHFAWACQRFPFIAQLDAFVLSYEVGATKPDPRIFHAALPAIRCEPQECFYIDDCAPFTSAGAAHGLQVHHFRGLAELTKTLRQLGIGI